MTAQDERFFLKAAEASQAEIEQAVAEASGTQAPGLRTSRSAP